MTDFFKGFNLNKGFSSTKKFLETTYTVCVKHIDGRISEHSNITNPWRYINSVKKAVDVDDAWVKSDG